MFSKRSWMIPTAFTMLFLIVGAEFHLRILVFPAILSFGLAAYVLYRDFGPRDPYDLNSLKAIHEREELARLDPDSEASGFDSFLCPYCDTVYSTEFPVCPKCKCAR